jgi:hypothetical protein
MRKSRAALAILGVTLFFLYWLNGMVFMLASLALGGIAYPSTHTDAHYFLRNNAQLTEVSRRVWSYSMTHRAVVENSWPIGFGGFALAFELAAWQRRGKNA